MHGCAQHISVVLRQWPVGPALKRDESLLVTFDQRVVETSIDLGKEPLNRSLSHLSRRQASDRNGTQVRGREREIADNAHVHVSPTAGFHGRESLENTYANEVVRREDRRSAAT